jgi:DNA-binding transcriptional ArsR family regulator
MSHAATNWAIRQRGLKPAAKVVLWHLCDRYHPDHGCFPSLDTLADDCEMSRRSVQDQLAVLEAAGLVRVEKMPREHGHTPRNRYRLAFENAPDSHGQNLPLAKSALGKKAPSPLANSRNDLGQNLPTNLVRGTSKGTSNSVARKRGARLPGDWALPDEWRDWAVSEHGMTARAVALEADKFRDYWHAKAGKDAAKLDWQATWRNWCRNAAARRPTQPASVTPFPRIRARLPEGYQ